MIFQDIYNSKIDQILKAVLETREEAESLKLARTVFPVVDVSSPHKADWKSVSLGSLAEGFSAPENQIYEAFFMVAKTAKVMITFRDANLTFAFIPIIVESLSGLVPDYVWHPFNACIHSLVTVQKWESDNPVPPALETILATNIVSGGISIFSPQPKGYEVGHNMIFTLDGVGSTFVLWRRIL